MKYYLLLILNISLMLSGQLLWKHAFKVQPFTPTINSLFRIVKDPYVFSGLVLFFFATLVWFVVLSNLPLSVAYPMQSIVYVLALIAGYVLFQENVTWVHYLGSGFILIGVGIIAKTHA